MRFIPVSDVVPSTRPGWRKPASGSPRAVGEEGRRLFLIRRANQGDIFLRIFIEIFFTALAAQFYFLLLMDKYEGGSHLAQFFTGYRARAEQICFHLGFVGQKPRGQSQGG